MGTDTLEAVRRQAYADGLGGKRLPRQVWTASDAFSRAYAESWLAGALAATAPITQPQLSPAAITARFL